LPRQSEATAGGIGGLLARSANTTGAHAYYFADGNGNITCMTDTNQSVVASYLYDPYGRILSQSGWLAAANLYRFSSKEFHLNSGLVYYLYRFYDPNLQRWLNRDPLGEPGGINLYGFVYNNPLQFIDTDGQFVQGLPILGPIVGPILGTTTCTASSGGAATVVTVVAGGGGVSALPIIAGCAGLLAGGPVLLIMITAPPNPVQYPTTGSPGNPIPTSINVPVVVNGPANGTLPGSPLPAGSPDPVKLPVTNPGRGAGGRCNPCPPNSAAWEVCEPGHGSPTTHWHWIEYHQDPKTCDCHPVRRSSPTKPPGA
jgi:RHS repeat-associated protein